MIQQSGCFMEKDHTEKRIRQIILSQPGIRATDITVMVGRSKGRVSQVIKKLTERKEIEQFRDASKRGLSLRPAPTWSNRKLIRMKWGKFRDVKPKTDMPQ